MSNGPIVHELEFSDLDEAYDSDGSQSTFSISSSIYNGLIENGRRYQNYKPGYSFVPSDELQFETYEAGHVVALLMESDRENPYFRAPINSNPQHILDIGTGHGSWAIEVADMFPNAVVRGVDLYPPPATWVPPNCIFEVDDISRDWTWKESFDLIHMRIMEGALTNEESKQLYEKCFENIRPGGWIEQLEIQPRFFSDNGTLPEASMANQWSRTVFEAATTSGRPMDLYEKCAPMIERAGFVDINIHETKWPIGAWSDPPVQKEAGRINLQHWYSGLDGYSMHLLTNYGKPTPWSWEEVMAYVAKFRKELSSDQHHLYHLAKRVWARKPLYNEGKISNPKGGIQITRLDDFISSECPD